MIELSDDPYLRRFWRNCPRAILEVMVTHVFAATLRNSAPTATDNIVCDLQRTAAYQAATPSVRRRMHSLAGHFVRVARGFVVERTPSGRPRRLRSRRGPHSSFTLQRPAQR